MLITNNIQYNELKLRLQGEYAFIHPVFVCPKKHYSSTDVSSYHFLFEDGSYYCYTVGHPDSYYNGDSNIKALKLIALHKKPLLNSVKNSPIVDLASLIHLNGGDIPKEETYYPAGMSFIRNRFTFRDINVAVPLVLIMQYAKSLLQDMRAFYHQYQQDEATDAFKFINTLTIPTLYQIEKAGMATELGEIRHSEYNIYTATGRPSNAFGGINFAALNKSDGTRKQFVSRYGNSGTLVQFDYEAFHLRLAANLMKYKLPDTSVHTYLAQKYYNTVEVTPEQYEESKARTFAIMYGQSAEDGGVTFFKEMKGFSDRLWEKYCQDGFVLSGTGRRVIVAEPSKNKVFNYMMQLTETEESLIRIARLMHYLRENRLGNVILYTYDAVLLDCPNNALEEVSKAAHNILTYGGFPIREYRGQNYDNLTLKI